MNINLSKLDVNGHIKLARENTRTWIAKGVFIVFVVLLVVIILISVWENKSLSDYNTIVSPLVGLLGVVIGFYFGKDNNE